MANDLIQAQEGMSLAFGAEVEVLGFNMKAFIKKEKDVQILVMPGVVDSGQEVSIGSMIAKINKTFSANIQQDSIDKVLEYAGLNAKDTMVQLNQAFFLYDGAAVAGASSKEYAFSISITNKLVQPEEEKGIFILKSISFSVWNSGRKSVIERMNIGTIEDMLKQLNTAAKLPNNAQGALPAAGG
jgi:hypothetical protein